MLNIKFINTGLDERIIKSWNPAHPKVYKPVEVHTEHGVLWENRPVNADIPEPVKQHHTKQPEESKLHPLIANAEFPEVLLPKYNSKLSELFNNAVWVKTNALGQKIVDIEDVGKLSIEEASKLAYQIEEEQKHYHPLVANAQFDTANYLPCTELSLLIGAPVVSYLSKFFGKRFVILPTRHNVNLATKEGNSKLLDEVKKSGCTVLTPKEMSDRAKQAENNANTEDTTKHNQQYFTQPVNELLLKATYKDDDKTYNYRLSSLFGTTVYTSLKRGKPVVIMDDTAYLAEGMSSIIDKLQYENSDEYKQNQLKAGIHPLVVNATFIPGSLLAQNAISKILNMKVTSTITSGKKEFMIFHEGKYKTDVTPKELSDMLDKVKERHDKLAVKFKHDSAKLNQQRQKELKQPFKLLDPATVKVFDWEGHEYFTGTEYVDDYPEPDSLFSEWKNNCLDYVSLPSYSRYSYQHDWKMNGYMRGKDYEYYPEMIEDIKNIEHTIDQFTLPDNIQVYRILADYNHDLDKFLSEVLTPAGESDDNRIVIQDKGFASTSVDWDAIKDWKSEYGRLKLVIDVPKGQGRGTYMAPISQFPDESEFLLQHGTMFKVLNVDKSNSDMYELHVQVVGCRPDMPDNPPDPNAKSMYKSIRMRRSKSDKYKSMRSSHDKHFVAEISDFNVVKL